MNQTFSVALNQPAGQRNFSAYWDDDYTLTLRVYATDSPDDTVPIDLTGAILVFKVAQYPYSSSVVVSGQDGVFTFDRPFRACSAREDYTIELTLDGDTTTVAYGTVVVAPHNEQYGTGCGPWGRYNTGAFIGPLQLLVDSALVASTVAVASADLADDARDEAVIARDQAVAAAAPLVDLPAATGSSLVGFKQAEANSVLRTVQSKLRERRSIEDFWASGDGNDFSMAFDRANAAGVDQLLLGPRAYIYSSTILLDDGFGLIGRGKRATVLTYQGTDAAISMRNRTGARIRTYGQTASGFSLVGPGKGIGRGIDMDSVSEAMLTDITIMSFATGHDMHSGISGGSVYNRLYGVKAQNCVTGYDWRRDDLSNISSYTSATTAIGCRANACDLGVSITGGNENAWIKGQIESNVRGALVNDPTGSVSCDMNAFHLCRFETNTTNWETGTGARYTQFLFNDNVGTHTFIDNGVATARWGGTDRSKMVDRVPDTAGSFRFERTQNGSTSLPNVVVSDSSSVGVPVSLQVENVAVSAGSTFLRAKAGPNIKFDMAAPSGKFLYPTPTNGPVGSITMASGASSMTVSNTCVSASSLIFLQAVNANAAKIAGSQQALYISARTAGTGFTVATGDGTNIAVAGASFFYWIIN